MDFRIHAHLLRVSWTVSGDTGARDRLGARTPIRVPIPRPTRRQDASTISVSTPPIDDLTNTGQLLGSFNSTTSPTVGLGLVASMHVAPTLPGPLKVSMQKRAGRCRKGTLCRLLANGATGGRV
jgi:hypothetical protein